MNGAAGVLACTVLTNELIRIRFDNALNGMQVAFTDIEFQRVAAQRLELPTSGCTRQLMKFQTVRRQLWRRMQCMASRRASKRFAERVHASEPGVRVELYDAHHLATALYFCWALAH